MKFGNKKKKKMNSIDMFENITKGQDISNDIINSTNINEQIEISPNSSDINENSEQIKDSNGIESPQKQKVHMSQLLCVFAIAFGLLIVTIGMRYGIQLVTNDFKIADNTKITDWNFVWGSSDNVINGDVTVWKKATKQKQVKKLSASENYLRMNYVIHASETNRKLVVETNYLPVKVVLDGETIYDTGYNKYEFVGSMRNSINIPASTNNQIIDVYMYVPSYQITLNTSLNSDMTGIAKYINYIGIIVAIGTMIAGIMMILSTFLISLKNIYLTRMIILGFTVITAGISLFISQVSYNTNLMILPVFYNLQLLFDVVAAIMIVICSFIGAKTDKKSKFMFLSPLILVSTVCLMFINSAKILSYILFGYTVLLLIFSVIIFSYLVERMENRLKYSWLSSIAFLYITAINIFNIISIALGFYGISRYIYGVGIFIFGVVLYAVFFKQSLNKVVRIQEREAQNIKNNEWSKKLATMFAELFVQKDNISFLQMTCEVINNILRENLSAYADHSVEASRKLQQGFRICAAIVNNGEITEITNIGGVAHCNYNNIIEKYKKTEKKIVFANTNFDMVIIVNKQVAAVIHVENIMNGLTTQFRNLIFTVQSNIELIYNNFQLKSEIELTQENIFIALAETVESISKGSKEHLIAVKNITRLICEQLGFSEKEAILVSGASVAHDIGKIAIPERILQKNGILTDQEREMMKRHIIYGYNILSQSSNDFMDAAAVIAYQHHEKYDGTGYLKFKGEQIHIYARIVAVADVFDALVSKRTYKDAWEPEKVYEYINERSGIEFDPQVVEAFNKVYDRILEQSVR